jgi:hypothetical protein
MFGMFIRKMAPSQRSGCEHTALPEEARLDIERGVKETNVPVEMIAVFTMSGSPNI